MSEGDCGGAESDGSRESKRARTENYDLSGRIPPGFEYFIPFDELPYLTSEIPGIGGVLKAECSHFCVTELLEMEEEEGVKDGEMFHWWLWVRRSNMTTREVQELFADKFGLKSFQEVGVAGLKDKKAIATQWLTIPSYSYNLKRHVEREELITDDQVEVLRVLRRKRRVKRGQHSGNRFDIKLTECRGTLEDARVIADKIVTTGVPNYFGQQRFGRGCSTALKGAKALLGQKKFNKWNPVDSFAAEAFTSMLFNIWLAGRVTSGALLQDPGCWGPLFGKRTQLRDGEADLLEKSGLPLKKFPGQGARRPGLLQPKSFMVVAADSTSPMPTMETTTPSHSLPQQDLLFTFELETSAYATSVLREFVKAPGFCTS